jgi:hypothetical protein
VAEVECNGAGDCGQGSCGRCKQGVCQYGCPSNQQCCQNTNQCAACCSDSECDDNIACTVDDCGSAGCTHTPDASLCPVAGYQCLPELGGCVQCTTTEHCNDGNPCTTDACNQQTHTCSYTQTCECKTAFDCQILVPQIGRPLPDPSTCPSCVDGKCTYTKCFGVCCSSGCYPGGLCPD